VRGHWNQNWINVAGIVSKYGDLDYLLLVCLIILVWGLVFRHRMTIKLAIALALCSSLAGIVTTTIRSLTGRTRPSANVAQGWYGIRHDSQWLVGKYQYNSFPSGHTGCAVGFAIPLFLGLRRGRMPAVLFAAAVGWSRVYLGCHHLSDVAVAAVIGITVGLFAWYRLIPKLFRA
jgi:membrane-associated phospholipid phosphatase